MRRGFKAQAERIADELREELGLAVDEASDLRKVAEHIGAKIRSADDLVPRQRLQELDDVQAGAFSAATFQLPDGQIVIVTNPLNSRARVNSDLGHELAHLILEHRTRHVEHLGGLPFFTCDPDQEAEANWLAGCLLLPRALLMKAARNGTTPQELAKASNVSVPMARFRLNTSGVLIQVGRGRNKG